MCQRVANTGFQLSPRALCSCGAVLSSTGLNNHSKCLSCRLAKDEVKTKLICETLLDLEKGSL